MGRAGDALKRTLEIHEISQNKLAVMMGVKRWHVGRWVHGQADPTGETIAEITRALRQLKLEAAADFAQLYLGQSIEEE